MRGPPDCLVAMHSPDHVAEVLRKTIRCIEQNADVGPDHPDLLELKRILLQKIALAETREPQGSPVDRTRPAA